MTIIEIKARADRLRELLRGLSVEVTIWKADPGPLLPLERRRYRLALHAAIAGLYDGTVVLDVALVRRWSAT